MTDKTKKEIRELHVKLKEEIATFRLPIPLKRIAQEMKKPVKDAEWYLNMMRKIGIRSSLVVIVDETGEKCVWIKYRLKK